MKDVVGILYVPSRVCRRGRPLASSWRGAACDHLSFSASNFWGHSATKLDTRRVVAHTSKEDRPSRDPPDIPKPRSPPKEKEKQEENLGYLSRIGKFFARFYPDLTETEERDSIVLPFEEPLVELDRRIQEVRPRFIVAPVDSQAIECRSDATRAWARLHLTLPRDVARFHVDLRAISSDWAWH
ncbi:hypothetical protein CYMTET_47645 [Cymbomonas tetramitiformis]|uniref:Uncharacterized protein n=1 Tax=Cymbomonas tetramitiformis TaxID=36881 RepID=A0AAE0EVY6_9CHLO|nr:hypothetical protein CYMTET_47645 [Cymbomonas tetramitiformis]